MPIEFEAPTAASKPVIAASDVKFFTRLTGPEQDDAANRLWIQEQIQAWLTVTEGYEKSFRQHKSTADLTAFKKLAKVIEEDTFSLKHNTEDLYARVFSLGAAFANHDAVSKCKEQVQKAKEDSENSDVILEAFTEYTYLLRTDGRVMVLTDNLRKAEIFGHPFTGPAYVQLPYNAALIVEANIPYTQYNPDTGKTSKANIVKIWNESKHRKNLIGITFDPTTTERVVNDQFNIWRGWAYEPVQSDADLPFWELVLDVLCNGNEEYFTFVRKWLAHMVQKPGERPLCAIGIDGPQGSGKSVFVKIIGGLMHGAHYNANVPMTAVAGNQQGRDLEGVLLAYLDEASWGGDKLSTGVLKKAITGEVDRINEKFVPAYNVPTYKRIIFSSNDKYYYHADADDRRLLPLEVDRSKPLRTYEFFQQLVDGEALRPTVQQALLHTLLHEDINGWVPFVELKKLKIDTGAAMLERSMSNVQRWLYESIKSQAFELPSPEKGDAPYTITEGHISIHDLKASYALFCSYDSFDKNRQVNLSANEPRATLVHVFGHEPKAHKNVRGYRIDWALMRVNFSSKFKWAEALWKDESVQTELKGLTV